MVRNGRLLISAAALTVLWAGLALVVSRPADAAGYHRTALASAEAAHDAATTGSLIGRGQLDGRVFPPFAADGYQDALRALSSAQRDLTEQVPPGEDSAALRDELVPLLQAVGHDLAGAASAGGDEELRDAVVSLDEDAQRLTDLIDQER